MFEALLLLGVVLLALGLVVRLHWLTYLGGALIVLAVLLLLLGFGVIDASR